MTQYYKLAAVACVFLPAAGTRAGDDAASDFTLLHRPLPKVEALNIAIAHNGAILEAKKNVEAATSADLQRCERT